MTRSKRKKILIVFGTRPEAIKLAPVIEEVKKRPEIFQPVVCVTGQHREMLDQVLGIFDIRPDHDLSIMGKNQTLHDITTRCLQRVGQVIEREKPDMIVVQGDTTTAFAAALAGFYGKIPIAHVEAGLRTDDKYQPYPEEINRRLVSQLADLHFAPTARARQKLLDEGFDRKRISVTGNTVIDALLTIVRKQQASREQEKWNAYFEKQLGLLLDQKKIMLVTGHRRENFGKGFDNICRALNTIGRAHPDISIIYPVHLNPNVQKPVRSALGKTANIHLIPPLEYEPFVYLMTRSHIILTDSGGIQEEAPSLGKPVLVMREKTERPEAVEKGTVRLVGTDSEKIVREVEKLLKSKTHYARMASVRNPYGDGRAAGRITQRIRKFISNEQKRKIRHSL